MGLGGSGSDAFTDHVYQFIVVGGLLEKGGRSGL